MGSGRVGSGRAAHTEISPLNHRRTRSALLLIDKHPDLTPAVLEEIENLRCPLSPYRSCGFGQKVLSSPGKRLHAEVFSHSSADRAPTHMTGTCKLSHGSPRISQYRTFFRRRLRAEGAKPKSNKRWKTGLGHVCMYVCMYVCIFVCFSHISHNLQRILSSNQYRSLAH